MRSFDRPQQGFTLLECLISMAVLVLVAGIGVPGFQSLARAHHVRATVADLSADFALARVSAISRGVPVVACPTHDGLRCIRDSEWARGWMVFPDADRNHQPDTPDDVISVRQTKNPRLRVFTNAGRPQLRYLPSGMSAGSNLTVSICDGSRVAARVVVNNAGRVRSERPARPADCPAG